MDNGATKDVRRNNAWEWADVSTRPCWAVGLMKIGGDIVKFALGGGWLKQQDGRSLLTELIATARGKRVRLRRHILAGALLLASCSGEPQNPDDALEASPGTRKEEAAPNALPGAGASVAQLPPSQRFTEFNEAHPLRPVQDALNAGNVDRAMTLLSDGVLLRSVDADTKSRLWAAIQKASDTQLNRSPGADYVERVQTHWLPQVEALPTSPAAAAAVGELLSNMDALRSYVADGENLSLTPAQRAVRSRFSSELSAKQRVLFPAIRRRYAGDLNAQLFRRDVAVTTTGARGRTLRITGPIFVRNANIEDMQMELTPVLARMRFGRVEYRWSRDAGEATYYDLKPPADYDVTGQ